MFVKIARHSMNIKWYQLLINEVFGVCIFESDDALGNPDHMINHDCFFCSMLDTRSSRYSLPTF